MQYYLFALHCGATGYSLAYQNYMFAEGFGQYSHFVNVSCEWLPSSAFYPILRCPWPHWAWSTACACVRYLPARLQFLNPWPPGRAAPKLITPGARPSWLISAASRIPCSAFFTYRAYIMYRRHWAVLAYVIPLMMGFTACTVGAVATFEYMPLPVETRRWILAMVGLSLRTVLPSPCDSTAMQHGTLRHMKT
jgi:hypothetical protein